jgi:CTP synthase (UTP-ammonia lyase)
VARPRIGVIGDFRPEARTHAATNHALAAAGEALGLSLEVRWVGTEAIEARGSALLEAFDGLWASPGSPYRSLEGALAGIRFARERGRPFIGT